MDHVSFDDWLESIRWLSASQRSHAFLTLSAAEADAGGDADATAQVDAATPPPVAVSDLARTPASIRPGRHGAEPGAQATPLAAVAQQRIKRNGCAHCGCKTLRRWGYLAGLPRYRCGGCRRSFNALTGTALAHLRKKEIWGTQAQALISGESLAKTAARCGVAASTAFRWRHRFLAAASLGKPSHLNGIVEADETFILESFKGRRSDLPRRARKRGGRASKCGLSAEQIPVLIARDRDGRTTDAVLPKLDRASVTAALAGAVTADNQLCCDGGKVIVGFARRAHIPCCILPAPGGPRREAPNLHINNINAYHGRLKEWLRPFHGVATKYLDHYLGWRRTVEALGRGAHQQAWLLSAMEGRACQQLTK